MHITAVTIILKNDVCVSLMVMCNAHRGQKGASDLEAGVAGYLTWVLGTEFLSSGRTASAPNH